VATPPGLCGMATAKGYMEKNTLSHSTSSDSTVPGASVAGVESDSNPSSTAGIINEPHRAGDSAGGRALHDLKRKTGRGALVSTFGQGACFALRTGSMVILARLLSPKDFGLVGMATTFTGFLGLFQDVGLSMAAVQRASITRAETSTLFWINLAVGGILAAFCAAVAPILTAFYHEPRLFWVTVVLGAGFVCSGAAAQHRATMYRDMRFPVLTIINIGSLLVSIAAGIGMAAAGLGYWALVGMNTCGIVVTVLGVWAAGGWMPSLPRWRPGVGSMLRYGGTLTLNNIIVYFAYNVDKVLLGRFWGAEVLGIYGRAYQLINLPTDNLNSTIGQVAFPALSRVQNDPARLRSYFLKGYGLFLSLVMPITMACALFAEDIVRVFLGPKWSAAVPVFRLLAPTILVFALMNPFAWLLYALGQATRSLKIALFIAPVVILSYVCGLSFGPKGVAAGFSLGTLLLVLPVIIWSTRGTPITVVDALKAVMRPLLSILIAAAAALAAGIFIQSIASPLLRLIVANSVLFGVYTVVQLFVMGQKAVYLGLLREIGVWPFNGRRGLPGSLKPADA
jgi:O-antigen/teichoic acid export membrane protein